MNITINQVQEISVLPVKLMASDGSGYTIVGGMPMFAQRIINNMSYAQKMRYDFYQSQLGRNKELEEC